MRVLFITQLLPPTRWTAAVRARAWVRRLKTLSGPSRGRSSTDIRRKRGEASGYFEKGVYVGGRLRGGCMPRLRGPVSA